MKQSSLCVTYVFCFVNFFEINHMRFFEFFKFTMSRMSFVWKFNFVVFDVSKQKITFIFECFFVIFDFFFQNHFFMMTWWNQNQQSRNTKIYLLIKSKRKFTKKFIHHMNNSNLRIWIDDFYDKNENVEKYENVLMFVNEIEIVAQISYIKQLLQNIKNFRMRIRNIMLMWKLNKKN